MARLMSVTLTQDAVLDRTKTVTRRLGWLHARPGVPLTLCQKVMGRKPGEPLVRLADVQIVSVRRERLDQMGPGEPALEGFPTWTAEQFVEFFTTHMRVPADTIVTRIEWAYLTLGPGPSGQLEIPGGQP